VDELGGFEAALALAKELAGLKPDREYTVVQVGSPRRELLPPPFPLREGSVLDGGIGALFGVLQSLARERVWALAPWTLQVQG
jgi:hypothetical protein